MSRLIRAVLVFLLVAYVLVFCRHAFAAAPTITYGQGPLDPARFGTVMEVCTAYAAWASSDSTINNFTCIGVTTGSSYQVRRCSKSTGASCTTITNTASKYSWCTATNTAPNTSKPLDQQCPDPPPPECAKDVKGEGRWQHGRTGQPSPAIDVTVTGGCVNSCKVDVDVVKSCHSYDDGFDYCLWTYHSTGATCTAGPGAPGTSTPPANAKPPRVDVPPFEAPPGKGCPGGTVQGGVSSDGVPICIGTGSDPKNSPPPPPKVESDKSEPTPDGGTKNTHTSTTTNADGSTTTTTTTTVTASDGTKTTTVDKNTTTNSTGGAGKDDSKQDDEKYDLCKQNPQLTICRNSSVAGTCGQITCQGDAIQCATLRAAAAMQCQQQTDSESLKTLPYKSTGEGILSGADPMKEGLDNLVKGTSVDLSKPTLDQGGFVGAGSCLANRTITVMGKAVEVNFTRVCQDIQPLRAAVMAVAFLVAYLIVSRSVLQA